ncbi:hypothetical protein LC593_23410 [Nostoc sp. CHAB 5844]|nr:hypothetical protein [Nostoc sp. CHAB 5844]
MKLKLFNFFGIMAINTNVYGLKLVDMSSMADLSPKSEELGLNQASYVGVPENAVPLGQIDTVALLQYGGISVAIILSLSCLIAVLNKGNADLIKVLLPLVTKKQNKRAKD